MVGLYGYLSPTDIVMEFLHPEADCQKFFLYLCIVLLTFLEWSKGVCYWLFFFLASNKHSSLLTKHYIEL